MAVDRGIPHTVSVWDWNEDYVMVKSRVSFGLCIYDAS